MADINKKSKRKSGSSKDKPVTKKTTDVKTEKIVRDDGTGTEHVANVKKTFRTKGMMCNNCEKIIAEQVGKLEGVKLIDIDYATEEAVIIYDTNKIDFDTIKKAIESKGYICDEGLSAKNTSKQGPKNKSAQKIINNVGLIKKIFRAEGMMCN